MPDEFSAILGRVFEGGELSAQQARAAMESLVSGSSGDARAAAFLAAMKMKGEKAGEIAQFAQVLRERMLKVDFAAQNLVDTCGTGGDNSGTFNVSTCAAIVAAGAGAIVAKHGNRAVSSLSGSADVLEKLGVTVSATQEEAKERLEKTGIAFLFAPAFHPALKSLAPLRKELGFRTVFNILGPLCNPTGLSRQVIGVYGKSIMDEYAQALVRLGAQRAMVVCSDCDELSVCAPTQVIEINEGKKRGYSITPEEFGFGRADSSSLRAANPQESARIILEVLAGKEGPCRDMVLLNSAAALYVSGIANGIKEGIKLSGQSIDSGKALSKLESLKTKGNGGK